jgi:hypothetical protein
MATPLPTTDWGTVVIGNGHPNIWYLITDSPREATERGIIETSLRDHTYPVTFELESYNNNRASLYLVGLWKLEAQFSELQRYNILNRMERGAWRWKVNGWNTMFLYKVERYPHCELRLILWGDFHVQIYSGGKTLALLDHVLITDLLKSVYSDLLICINEERA